jgi:hypothetical protein
MYIKLIILFLLTIKFIRTPSFAIKVLSFLSAFWIEWSFPQLLDVRIGLIDIVLIGGSLGCIVSAERKKSRSQYEFKALVISYIFISLMVFIINHSLAKVSTMQILWGLYKEIYITSLFFIFIFIVKSKENIEEIWNLFLLGSVIVSLIGIVQGLTQSPKVFLNIGIYGICC